MTKRTRQRHSPPILSNQERRCQRIEEELGPSLSTPPVQGAGVAKAQPQLSPPSARIVAQCLRELFSLATLRASTCAGIHVPTFYAHPIGRRPGRGRVLLAKLTSQWLPYDALIGDRRGHSRSCPLICVARVYGGGVAQRRLEPSTIASGCKHKGERSVARARARITSAREMHNMFYASDGHGARGPAHHIHEHRQKS